MEIPINQTVQSITFYHTTSIPNADAGLSNWNKATFHPHIGTYEFIDENQDLQTIPAVALKYRLNIQDWNNLYGSYDSQIAWTHITNTGVKMQVQKITWTPKSPNLMIKSIRFSSTMYGGINPILLGISVNQTSDNTTENKVATQKIYWQDSFDDTSLEQLQSNWKGIDRPFDRPYLQETAPHSNNNALRWELQAAKGKIRQDLGFQVQKLDLTGANELQFKMRKAQGEAATAKSFTCALYLGNTIKKYWYRYVFTLPLHEDWQTYQIPLSGRFTEGAVPKEGGMSDLNTFMMSVWHQNDVPVVLLLDDMKIVKGDGTGLLNTVR